MTMRPVPLRGFAALAALGLLSGCGSFDAMQNLIPHHQESDEQLNTGVNARKVAGTPGSNPAEKPAVLAVASQDINCPSVDVPEGGAALRVGGADNASVRYQFNIGETARQCDPAGPGQASIKIGVSGEVVVGQAGSAGTFSAPLRVTITSVAGKKAVYSKVVSVQATTDGVRAGQFRFVTDPIPVPMPSLQLADVYTITVGFGSGGGEPKAKPHRRRQAG
jgi:hypothetical protein